MQPYQKATDEYLNQKQRLATTLTTAGSAAIPAAKIGFAAAFVEKRNSRTNSRSRPLVASVRRGGTYQHIRKRYKNSFMPFF